MKIFVNDKVRIVFIILTVFLSFLYCITEYYYLQLLVVKTYVTLNSKSKVSTSNC